MSSINKKHPVVIIGAGPTGTALAIDLALRNTPSILVERYTQPQAIPKGQNLTQRTGEHFRCWGISKEIRKATLIPPEYGNEGLVAFGNLLSDYHYDWFKRGTVREFYAADNERLPQFETERILRDRAKQFDCITTHYGWTFAGSTQNDNQLEVTLEKTNGTEQKTLYGSYLVGCDGARSAVRESVSIPLSSNDTQRRMALLVFHSPDLHKLLEDRFPGKTIFNAIDPANEGYWQFFGKVDLNANWFFHAPVPMNAELETYGFQQLLHTAVGKQISAKINYKGFWDLRFTHAESYRQGLTFIAGDAAHNHPPYGGYGVNTGFEDARNLSWKLAAHYHGWGTDSLLDSYCEERHPVFASTRDDFILRMLYNDADFVKKYSPEKDLQGFKQAWQQRATQGQREVAGFVPHYVGSPIVLSENTSTTSGAKGKHTHEPYAGGHLSPGSFNGADALFDNPSQEFTLMVPPGGESIAQKFEQAAATLQIPFKLHAVTERGNTEGVKNRKADSGAVNSNTNNRQACVLVRPDHFIAWVENCQVTLKVDDISGVLARCAGLR